MSDEPEMIPGRKIQNVMRKFRLGEVDEDLEMMEYWLSRPMEERISVMEELRSEFFGVTDASESRLSRPSLHIHKRQR